MLSKKELRALEVPQLPQKRTDAIYRANSVEYILRSGLALDGDMLIVAFYGRESAATGFSLPLAVLYQTKDEFVTLFNNNGKQLWHKSRIMGQLNVSKAKKQLVFLGKHDEARVRAFLPKIKKKYSGQSDDTASRLGYFQDYILETRLAERQKKQYESLTKKINQAAALPEDYQEWVQTGAMVHHQYVFYKRRGKKKADAYCTACKKEMVIEKALPLHLELGVCPSCGHKITFRAIGKSVNTYDKVYTSILQEVGANEYAIRYYENIRCFKPAPDAVPQKGVVLKLIPSIKQTEVARVYFNSEGDVTDQFKCQSATWRRTRNRIVGNSVQWDFRMYYRWFWHYWFEPGYLYPNNLLPLFDKLGISYKLKDKVCAGPINVTTPILQNVKYPYLESIAAMGLKTLYEDISDRAHRFAKSTRSGKLHDCLSVSKSFLTVAQNHKLEVKDFDLAASYGVELSEEDYLWLASIKPAREFMDFFMQFCTVTEIRHYMTGRMILMDRYDQYECNLSKQMTWWRDYLQMCFRLDHDMTDRRILFPYNLRLAHEYVMKMSNVKPDPKWDKKIVGCYDRLYNAYHYENGGYVIRPPKNYTEFAEEGNRLLHCVCINQYYINHVKGTNLIFFVRKAEQPEKPLYTLEYIPNQGKIQQFYGYDNSQPDSMARAFVHDWKDYLKHGQKNAELAIAA